MKLYTAFLAVVLGFSAGMAGCGKSDEAAPSPSVHLDSRADSDLARYRVELLDAAFQAASSMPMNPHVKNRARAQEQVLRAALQLGQRKRAREFVEQIPNWRRGLGYALLAVSAAEQRDSEESRRWLQRAQTYLSGLTDESVQDWQRDRIRAKTAEALLLLGDDTESFKTVEGLIAAEGVELAAARTNRITADGFAKELDVVRRAAANGEFDLTRQALAVCVRLFDLNYQEKSRRQQVLETARTAWAKLPLQIRVETLIGFADAALKFKDETTVIVLVDEAKAFLETGTWTPETKIPLLARLARTKFLAGADSAGRADFEATRGMYRTLRVKMVDIDRAAVVIALAEAAAAFGDRQTALEEYAAAAEELLINPNSRPRAEDLTRLLVSLALNDCEPDKNLALRLNQIREGLGQPW